MQRTTAGSDLGQRDEGHVDGGQPWDERKVRGLHPAGVETLDCGDTRVISQPQVKLAKGNVDRGDPGGAALQEAVGEAPGRAADIKTIFP